MPRNPPPPIRYPRANSKIPEIPLEKNSGSAQDGCGEFTQVNHLPTISYMYIIKWGGGSRSNGGNRGVVITSWVNIFW